MTGALHHSGEQQARIAVPGASQVTPELSESLVRLLGRYGMMRAALRP
jgi:hypothetical protein